MNSISRKFQTRADALNLCVNIALLIGIAMSWRLWFPSGRSFPAVPFLFPAPGSITYLLSALLLAAIVAAIFGFNRTAVVALLMSLILFDQMRLQPWVYQYLILLFIITLSPNEGLLLKCQQLIVAALYFWSGLQKINFNFHQEVLSQLMAPWGSLISIGQKQSLILGVVIALSEILIGVGLLLKRTRKVFVWVAIAMHAVVLALLIKLGHNSVVWIWNVAMIAFVVILFWRVEQPTLGGWRIDGKRSWLLVAVTVCVISLPVLSFFGWWDQNLSGVLYSGTSPIAVIRIDEKTIQKLSNEGQQTVFDSNTNNDKFLPLLEWSLAELNVPPYSEQRVFAKVAGEICKLSENSDQVELIVREQRSRFAPGFDVKRWNCAEIK
jgi:hypothetical protein